MRNNYIKTVKIAKHFVILFMSVLFLQGCFFNVKEDNIIKANNTFSIKQPNGWVMRNNMLYSPERSKNLIDDFVPPPSLAIKIISEYDNFDSFISSMEDCVKDIINIKVGTYDAREYTYTCTRLPSTDIVIMIDGKIVRGITYPENKQEKNIIINDILPTLKFTK